jgi:hypothetical protein
LLRLLVTASVVSSSPNLVTLMMELLSSSETSVLTTATRCKIPKDAILNGQICSHLNYYEISRLYRLRYAMIGDHIISVIYVIHFQVNSSSWKSFCRAVGPGSLVLMAHYHVRLLLTSQLSQAFVYFSGH